MRTTLNLDDDVLAAVKALSERNRQTIGTVLSDLARRALQKPIGYGERNGVPLLPSRGATPPITLDLVNELRDDAP